jgi:hypothetical protein
VAVGAAAALAFTVLAVREYRVPAPAAVAPDGSVPAHQAIVAAAQPVVGSETAPSIAVAGDLVASAAETSPVESITVVASLESGAFPLPATLAAVPVAAEIAPAALATTASYASVSLNRSALGSDIVVPARLAAAGATFEARPAQAARTVVDPLHQMTPPGESRRNARLFAAMASPVSAPPVSRGSERAASRISEETVYEQVSRFGVRGDRFNVKF